MRGEKVKRIPELRFEEFHSEWTENKLGNVLKISSASRVHKEEWTEKGVSFFRSSDVVSAFKGIENTKAFISKDLFDSLSKKSGRTKKDDLLITGGGSIGIPFLIKNDDPIYFKDADLLWLKKSNEINGYFLYSFFLTQTFRKYLKCISHIGTIAHYTINQAKDTPCKFPALPEQTKIANFLSAVDTKIANLTEEKTLLENYKKGAMQKIFNQELRFKGADGNDFPEWETKRLGEIAIKINAKNKNVLHRNVYTNSAKFGIVDQRDYFDHDIANQNNLEGYYIVSNDDFVYNPRISKLAPVGPIKRNKMGTGVMSPLYVVFRFSEGNQNFLEHYFHSKFWHNYMRGVANYGARHDRMNISSSNFFKMPIPLPKLKEQTKIANFLTSIDDKIEAVTSALDQTQTFKKGLLQQLFV